MKVGQLIDMAEIFFLKYHTENGGKASCRPFYKKSKLNISLDQHTKMLYFLFLLDVQV